MTRAVLSAAVLVLACLPARAQVPGGTIDAGDWQVSDSRGVDGSFAGCAAMRTSGGGNGLGVVVNETTEIIMVVDPAGKLVPGSDYDVKFHFDAGPAKSAPGQASGAQILAILASPDDVNGMVAAKTLFIEVDGTSISRPVDGAKVALTALAKCLDAGLGKQPKQ